MKLFLTWNAEPEDPHFWKLFNVDGIVVPLRSILATSKWKLNRLLSVGFKRFYGYRGFLLVDSLLKSLRRAGGGDDLRTQFDVLYMQYLLGADVLVHKDLPMVNVNLRNREKFLRKNVLNAEFALKVGDRLGKKVMLVVHGWDVDTYVAVADHYANLGAEYIGIGSLLAFKDREVDLAKIIEAVRGVVGRRVHIHVFGVNPLRLSSIACFADSADVSTPLFAAGKKEVIMPGEDGVRRVKLYTIEGFEALKNRLDETSDELERDLLNRVLNAKTPKGRNQAIMIYNYYVFTSYYRQLNRC